MTKRRNGPSARVRLLVLKRDRYRCTYCDASGSDAELEIDHIIAISKGGSNAIGNLTTACRRCNLEKGAGDAPTRRAPPKRQPKPAAMLTPDQLVQAGVRRVVHDLRLDVVEIWLEEGDCTDMSGAIELAQRFDPNITRINTFSGKVIDTKYRKWPNGQWVAVGWEPPSRAMHPEVRT